MLEPQENNNLEEKPVLSILKQINSGELDPKQLNAPQRRQCVEALKIEGQSYANIAKVLEKSEKTIKRDWDEICRKNAEKPSPDYALRLIAQAMMKLQAKEDYLTRLASSKEGSMQEKAQAMYYASRVLLETYQLLQSMGYLPKQATQIQADISYRQESETKTLPQLKEELDTIERISKERNILDEATQSKIESLRERIKTAEIANDVNKLNQTKTQEADDAHKEE